MRLPETYMLDGKRLPSVTEIINAIFPMPPVDPWYLQRGTATHLACELADKGMLDWGSVDSEILPRVEAWMKFRRDLPMPIVANEQGMKSATYRFAGTVDRVFDGSDGVIVADLKNSVSPQVALQLAMYSILWTETRKQKVETAVAVELLETGDYRCHWLKSKALRLAERQALALITVYGFAVANNLVKEKK